jgi:hypothetical protein
MARRLAQSHAVGALVVLLCVVLAGCSSYRRIPPPDPGAELGAGHMVRVTLDTGERVTLRDLRVAADSVRGVELDGDPAAYATERVVRFETSRFDPAKSVLIPAGIALVIYLASRALWHWVIVP